MEVEMEAPAPQDPAAQQPEGFDLEAYIAAYTGHARIKRLLFIAEKHAGKPLELDALKLAADLLRRTEDTQKYLEVMERIGGRAGPQYVADSAWVEQVDRAAEQRLERMENELTVYKSNLIKESIRMGHTQLGDFFYARGDLQNAFKHYMRTRDYCTTARHVIKMCLQVVKCSLELGNYIHLSNYVQKAETALLEAEKHSDPSVASQLACASGMYCLEQGRYRAAAMKLTDVALDIGLPTNEIRLAPQDVAIYGTLCGMAALSRSELSARLVHNVAFREFLELVPEAREALADFYASSYASCLRHLEALRPLLKLDPHLHKHVDPLYRMVRNKAVVQYTAPFASLELNGMAKFFNTTVSKLEKELAALIASQQIKARIDSHAKVLYARKPDQRSTTYAAALKAGEEYVRTTRALLLRASIMQHDLIAKPAGGVGVGGGGGPERPDRGEGPPGRHGRHRGERRGDRAGGDSVFGAMGSGAWNRLGGRSADLE